jgi:hypothetical protein
MARQPQRRTGRELSPAQQAAYELGLRRVLDQPPAPVRVQTTTRRSIHVTEGSFTITEETTYTEDY